MEERARIVIALLGVSMLAGCQTPLRCGAYDEPCCETGCYAPAACSLGICGATVAAGCPGTTGPCDITQQNCGAGESCTLISGTTATTACEPSGGGIDQQPCADGTQCAPGHYCSALSGLCHRLCCGDVSCTGSQACLPAGDATAAGYCVGNACDPVAGTGCQAGAGCYLVSNEAGELFTGCLPPGTAGADEACVNLLSCAPGLACTTADTCRPLCHPSAGCAGTCTPIPGIDDLGLCN